MVLTLIEIIKIKLLLNLHRLSILFYYYITVFFTYILYYFVKSFMTDKLSFNLLFIPIWALKISNAYGKWGQNIWT